MTEDEEIQQKIIEEQKKMAEISAEETMLLAIAKKMDDGKINVGHAVINNANMTIYQSLANDICVFCLNVPLMTPMFKVGDKLEFVVVDVTNDPTAPRANHIVSLGYYCLRIRLENVEIKSMTPFAVQGTFDSAKHMKFTRPLRRLTCLVN